LEKEVNNRETRSPIKNLPVRQPGQSLREYSFDLTGDVLIWVVTALLLGVVAIEAWLIPPKWFPSCVTLAALIVVPVAVFKFRRVNKELKALRAGRTGEEAVGQFLEEKLRPDGFQILHDIPGDGFNVDHVIIGLAGIFTIETKTRSKPIRGDVRIQFDGARILVDGFDSDRDPVKQAKAQAHWLGDLLAEMTSKRFQIQPVILFPGWFVEMSNPGGEIWVLNENALLKFIANAKPKLSKEEVAMITFHLKQYVINRQPH
jgi:hypothetical protein